MATWNSRGLRGSTLEDLINRTNEKYQENGLALIQKIPTPITPIRIDKDERHITLAYFDQKSTVDYIGAVQGLPVCFDAKECALAYGAANAAVYAAVGLLSSAMRVHLEQLTVQCAFGQERSRWVIRGRLHFCPLSALLALGSFALGYVMQKNRQEDAEKEPAAEKEHAAAR